MGIISSRLRERVTEKIHIECVDELPIKDDSDQPYAEFVVEIHNQNFMPLTVDGLDISVSFGRTMGQGYPTFRNFYWSRNDFSKPPNNIKLSKIKGDGKGKIRIDSMLPYYLYFPTKKDTTLVVHGRLKFDSDVGPIECEFKSYTHLIKEELWNRTTAQDRLMESFAPARLLEKDYPPK